MPSRSSVIKGPGRAATNARALSLRGQRVPVMAAKLSRPAMPCCLKPPHELDRPARAGIETARRDCPARAVRFKFRLICLESVSIQNVKHRGARNEVLLGPF
jgi:hypothetical protein